jgi:DNA repair photolyase
MFKTITRTWNPFTGCLFDCTYCWARKLALEKLQTRGKKYKDGFSPCFHPYELNRRFKPGDFVFVSDMGDIAFARLEQRRAIVRRVSEFPETRFLFQTKDPRIYDGPTFNNLPNVYLGTTLETNRNYGVTRAPSPLDRYLAMVSLQIKCRHKFLSIEPIMDFDLNTLERWIGHIQPEIVEVGADNYHNDLPEPSWEKVEALLEALRKFVPRVIEKDGLARLKKGG